MGIVRRIGRLINSDLNGLLDLLEDPSEICKQAIREMEAELAALEQSIKERERRINRVAGKQKELGERLLEIVEQLRTVLASGNERLQRSVLRKKLEQEKLGRLMMQRMQSLRHEQDCAGRRKAEYRERLAAIQEKLSCLAIDDPCSDRLEDDRIDPLWVSEEEVEVALQQVLAEGHSSQPGK